MRKNIKILMIFTFFFTTVLGYAVSEKDFSNALSYENYKKVESFLSNNKIDLNKPLKSGACEGFAPLHCTDSIKIMKLLIANGADINKRIANRTAIESAANNKDRGASGLFLLEQGATPNSKALYTALWYENIKLAEKMLDMGVGADYQNKEFSGYTPLILATSNGYSLRLIKKIVNAGADINASTNEGYTALHFFRNKRSVDHQGFVGDLSELNVSDEQLLKKVEYLVSKGASIHKKTKAGFTPFMIASAQNEKVAFRLIELGANVNDISKKRDTALQMAAGSGFEKLVKYLLDNGAKVNAKNREGRTAIFYGAQSGIYSVIKMLIDRGAKCKVRDRKGYYPLHLISIWPTAQSHYIYFGKFEKEFYKGLELILKKSGRKIIHRRNRYGETPWFNLTGWMYPLPEKIRLFLKYGARKNIRDRKTRKTLLQTLLKTYNSKKAHMAEYAKKVYKESIEALR